MKKDSRNKDPKPDPRAGLAVREMSVRIFGVGTAGVNVLERLSRAALPGAVLAAVNLDPDSLSASTATEKIPLQLKATRGPGDGGDAGCGRALAEQHLPEFKAVCEGADVVFLVAGLGGGAGSGASPVIARAAREIGALVLAFVTFPFDCEGNRRQRQAQQGLQELKAVADGVICLPNQKLLKLVDEKTRVHETFQRSDELLAEAVIHVWRLMACPGLIEIHFDDLGALLRDRHGECSVASAEADGPERVPAVVEKLFAHPMLDHGRTLADSDAVLVSLVGGPELTMSDINGVMEQINRKCSKAQVIVGAAVDESFGSKLAVTVVASRHGETPVERAGKDEAADAGARAEAQAGDDLNQRLLNRIDTPRPHSRFVPPPPELSPEKLEQLMPEATGAGRRHKSSPRMRQTQLPLEIVSKGRFDKSEPTIHNGEDLDVPTYIRRGVSLN